MLPHEWPVNSENSVSFTTFGCFGVIWDIWNEITKSIERFEDLTFRPIDYNALDREFRPGKLLSTEIRRRIVDLYLSGEAPREISPTVRLTYRRVCRIISHYQTYGTYFPLSRGGRRNPSKLSDNVLESIELFKLMKPSMFGREIRERLLNDGMSHANNLQCAMGETYRFYRL